MRNTISRKEGKWAKQQFRIWTSNMQHIGVKKCLKLQSKYCLQISASNMQHNGVKKIGIAIRYQVPGFIFFTYISYELSHPRSFSICSTMGPKNFEIALIFFEPSFYVSRDIFHSFEQCEDRQNVMNFLADISNTTSERISPHCIHLKWKEEWSIVTYILLCFFDIWCWRLLKSNLQCGLRLQIVLATDILESGPCLKLGGINLCSRSQGPEMATDIRYLFNFCWKGFIKWNF